MSIHIISLLMIKFILPIAVFIATVFGISYLWTNSSLKDKKMIALRLNNSPCNRYISNNLPNI
jgi:hypothetical protein